MILGEPRVSAFQRVVKFAKMTALLSAGWTILCAATIVVMQVTSWIRNGVWDTYRLSSILKNLKGNHDTTYVTASADKFGTELTIKQGIADWLLGMPAILPLLIVAALHLAFYLRLAAIEKSRDGG
jgi:hypothetical protein